MQIFKPVLVCTIILTTAAAARSSGDTELALLSFSSTLNATRTQRIQNELARQLVLQKIIVYNVTTFDIRKAILKDAIKKKPAKEEVIRIGDAVNRDFILWGDASGGPAALFSVTVTVIDVKNRKSLYRKTMTGSNLETIIAKFPLVSVDISQRILYRKKEAYPHTVSVSYAYFFPDPAGFNHTVSGGHGCSVLYDYTFLHSNLSPGCGFQFFAARGNRHYTDRALVVPLSAHLGCRFRLWKITAVPRLHLGGIYCGMFYYSNEQKNDYRLKKSFHFLGKLSMQCNIVIFDPVTLMIGCEYAVLKYNTFRTYYTLCAGFEMGFF